MGTVRRRLSDVMVLDSMARALSAPVKCEIDSETRIDLFGQTGGSLTEIESGDESDMDMDVLPNLNSPPPMMRQRSCTNVFTASNLTDDAYLNPAKRSVSMNVLLETSSGSIYDESDDKVCLRRRADSDFVTVEHFVKAKDKKRRGLLLLGPKRTSRVVAVHTNSCLHDWPGVESLQCNLEPEPEPEPEPNQISNTKPCLRKDTSESAICLICMGPSTKKKPLIPIPCSKTCNKSPVHLKCIYEWKEHGKGNGTCILCRSPLNEIDYDPPDYLHSKTLAVYDSRKQFNLQPIPKKAGMIRCYIIVRNGFWGSPATYEMFMQEPQSRRYPGGELPDACSPHSGDIALMYAKKRLGKWGASQIDIGMSKKNLGKSSPNHLGLVQAASVLGLEHNILAANRDTISQNLSYGEVGCVAYRQNRVGAESGPRKMSLLLPQVMEVDKVGQSKISATSYNSEVSEEDEDEDEISYSTAVHYPEEKKDSLLNVLKQGSSSFERTSEFGQQFIQGRNKQPYWLEAINAHSLDFNGRVTVPSNKNFQLELQGQAGYHDNVALQFGKVFDDDKNVSIYTLDFSWPFSPLQAFGIALSSCDRKLACA